MEDLKIYYAENGERRGPFTLDQITALNLPANTLIFYSGLQNWTAISQAPVTAHLYQVAPPQPEPEKVQPEEDRYVDDDDYNDPEFEEEDYERPANYLPWAIVCTAALCWPFGIPAIVNAAKVNRLWDQGQYDEAYEASHKAKKFCITSTILGAIWLTIYFIISLALD